MALCRLCQLKIVKTLCSLRLLQHLNMVPLDFRGKTWTNMDLQFKRGIYYC